jgi:hypothetical protein
MRLYLKNITFGTVQFIVRYIQVSVGTSLMKFLRRAKKFSMVAFMQNHATNTSQIIIIKIKEEIEIPVENLIFETVKGHYPEKV